MVIGFQGHMPGVENVDGKQQAAIFKIDIGLDFDLSYGLKKSKNLLTAVKSIVNINFEKLITFKVYKVHQLLAASYLNQIRNYFSFRKVIL